MKITPKNVVQKKSFKKLKLTRKTFNTTESNGRTRMGVEEMEVQ